MSPVDAILGVEVAFRMNAAQSWSPGYRGNDRRAGARAVVRRRQQVPVFAAGAVAVLALVTTSALLAEPAFADQLWALSLALWCTAAVGAGVGLLIAWRVGGWALPARVGTALLAAGVLVSLVPRLSSAVGLPAQVAAIRPVVLAAILLAAGIQCGRAVGSPVIDTAVRPGRELLRLIAIALVAVLVGRAVLELLPAHDSDVVRLLPAVAAATGGGWVCLAARRRPGPAVVGLALFWWATAGAFAVHALTSAPAAVLATSLIAAAGVPVAVLAWHEVARALAVHHLRSLRTLAALAEHSDAVQRERERRHDALNAVAAIRAASDVLAARAGDLDAVTRAQLVEAARAELGRVERMLSPSGGHQPVDVHLESVLGPVLLGWRQRGLALDVRLEEAIAHAAPDVVCRIVDNLLQNAHRHARDAAVRLRVARGPGQVHLDVTDDGPGSNDKVVGEGIGLASSRRLARDVGGELVLLRTTGPGCHVRLTLPTAVRPPMPTPLRQQAG